MQFNVKSQDAFNAVVNVEVLDAGESHAVVLFTAPAWCVPCQRLHPHWERLVEERPGVYIHVDVDEADTDFVKEWNVMGVPTMLIVDAAGKYYCDLEGRTAAQLKLEIEDCVAGIK